MTRDEFSLSFPDGQRSELDQVLIELVDRAQQVLATQGRLRALVRAHQAVVQELDLPSVLRTIVESAVDLLQAKYGALGVISPAGGLEQFIHVGMDDDAVHSIGHLPEGHGLLGALIDDPRAIRLAHVQDDPRSAGFPAHHPPMGSFLGVPVRIRDEVFGNLYLTDSRRGHFTEEDEQLATSLAATAGYAIENARLFAETRRRQAWAAASAEVTAAMLNADQDESLGLLVERVLSLADADVACLVSRLPEGTMLRIDVCRGLDEEALAGREFDGSDSVALAVMEAGQPQLVVDSPAVSSVTGVPLGPVLAVPLVIGGQADVALVVGRRVGAPAFATADLEMAADFAGHAGVALELSRAKRAEQQLVLLEDRGRIARDLHDHVIQQLFGTGLDVQSVAAALPDGPASRKLSAAVDSLDGAIAQIRTVIFALTAATQSRESIRHRLIDLAGELSPAGANPPSVSFSGPVDLVVRGALAGDVLAVAREGLTNAIRHSGGSTIGVDVRAGQDSLEVVISDDGHGITGDRRSGLDNLTVRAELRGGTLQVRTGGTGTRLVWSVPITDLEDSNE